MAIPYRLHLTFLVQAGRTGAFADACAELGGKTTLIKLPRRHSTYDGAHVQGRAGTPTAAAPQISSASGSAKAARS